MPIRWPRKWTWFGDATENRLPRLRDAFWSRRRAVARVLEAQRRYRTLAEAAPVGIFHAGPQGDYHYVNKRWSGIAGLPASEASGTGWLRAVDPADRAEIEAAWQAAIRATEPFAAEYRLRHEDGTIVWVLGQAAVERDTAGAAVGYVGTITDISAQRAGAEALRASEAKFASAFAVSPQAISITAIPSGQFLDVNEALVRFSGYGRDELIGRTPLEVSLWADRQDWELGRDVLLREGRLPQREVRFRRKDGSIIVGLAAAERIAVGGQPAILTVIADITERKLAEENLRRNEEQYRILVESIDQGVCILEMIYGEDGRPCDYRFLEVNPTFEGHTGLKDAAGKTARELVPNLEDYWVELYGRVAETGQSHRFSQGSAAMGRWFEVEAVRVGGAESRKVALFFTDVSERLRSEEALQRSAQRDAFRAALTDALRPLTDPGAIEAEAARLLGEHLRVNRAFYAEVEADGDHIVLRHDYHEGVPSAAGRYRLGDFGPTLATSLRDGRTLVVNDVAEQQGLTEAERAAYAAIQVRAHTTVCLVKDGRIVGLFGVRQTVPRVWTADEVALVEETAERTWAAIERAGAELALRDSEERLHLALSGARVGTWEWDFRTERMIWSPEHYDLLGLPRDTAEFTPAAFAELIHPADRRRVQAEIAAALAQDDTFDLEYRVTHADGTERWLNAVGRIERDEDGQPIAAIGIHQDFTVRRQAEERVALLGDVSTLLAGTLDEEAALAALARLIVRGLADWCLISTLEPDGQVHRRAYAHVDPARELLLRELPSVYPYNPAQPYGAASVITSGNARLVAALTPQELADRTSAPLLPSLQDLGVASGMIVPLRARGSVFGAVSLFRANEGRLFGEADLALAEQIAERAAVTLDSVRLYTAERSARAAAEQIVSRQAAQAEAARLFAEAGPALEPLLTATARYLTELLGDGCVIGLVADDGAQIVLAAADHLDPAAAEFSRRAFTVNPLRVGTGIIGKVAATGQPELHPVVDQSVLLAAADLAQRPLLERYAPRSLMVVPCRVGGRTIGVISLARHTPDRPYNRDDLTLLSDLADRAALAIERARLYEAERRAREQAESAQSRLAVLADAGIVLARSLDEEATLASLARLIVAAFADWCTINLVADDGTIRPIALHRDPARQPLLADLLRRYPAELRGEGPVAHVLRSGESVIIAAGSDGLVRAHALDDAYLELLAQIGLSSTMIVPLFARQRLMGALRFARTADSRPYDADDLRLAEELARRAALALDNARLYRETRDAVFARDRFLSIAAHELRTPVTSMRAYAQLARRRRERGQLTPELVENALASIERGTTRLNTLIQDLLDVARLQSGQLRIERSSVDLAALVQTAAVEAQTQLPASLALTVAGTGQPYLIQGDAGRLEQVLGNLLENARKYSPDGGLIAVDLTIDDQGATVTVRDEGIGLDPGEERTIFTPFNRSEEALRRQIQGLGLGLAICRAIVEDHGGTLTASSAGSGQGTVFTLWLPPAHNTVESEAVPVTQ